jgi:hypothetical protein
MTMIKLKKPIQWLNGSLTEIRLKEPSGQLFIDLGEPRVIVSNRTGSIVWAEIPETIKSYLDHLIDHEGGGALLAQMSISDAKKVKQALFDFFLAAPAETTE